MTWIDTSILAAYFVILMAYSGVWIRRTGVLTTVGQTVELTPAR